MVRYSWLTKRKKNQMGKIINVRSTRKFASADIDFIIKVLGEERSDGVVNQLLDDDEMLDIMLDDRQLIKIAYQNPTVSNISDKLFYYITLRHVLFGFGVDDRQMTDYVADLLTVYLSKHTENFDKNMHLMAFLYESLTQIERGDPFEAHSNVGSYTLFITGVFPEEIRFKKRLDAKPKIKYFEAMGAKHFLKARRFTNKPEVKRLYRNMAKNYRKLRLALNVMAEHHIYNRDTTLKEIL